MAVQLNFDYIEKEFTTSYFSVMDIMSKVGGLQASVMPLMRIATPFFMLRFLLDLSVIIRNKSKLNYRNE